MTTNISTIAADKHNNIAVSDIENIDAAFLKYIDELNIFVDTNEGFKKVPHIWVSAERAYQLKNSIELRDANGTLIPPMIALERTSISKDPSNKGSFQANLSPKNDKYVITKVLNQEKTGNFANVNAIQTKKQINFLTSKKNKKIVYQHIEVPIPIYITVEYKINVFTNYQSQLNEIFNMFLSNTAQNYFVIESNGYRYECFPDKSFNQESIASLGEKERIYTGDMGVRVLGYLVSPSLNSLKPSITTFENQVDIKFNKESQIIVNSSLDNTSRTNLQAPLGTGYSTGGVSEVSSAVTKKTFIIGDGNTTTFIINHKLNTTNLFIQVRENFGDYAVVQPSIEYIDRNTITVTMEPTIDTDSHTVIILG